MIRLLPRSFACVVLGVLLFSSPDEKRGFGQEAAPEKQSAKRFQGEVKVQVALDYLLYLPKGYSTGDKAWPLVLFLHGAGESGSDLQKVKIHGPPKHVETGEDYPFVLVSPQAPTSRRGWEVAALNALIDDVVATHKIDKNRIYVTGLSMGGYGTWALAQAYPKKFAAIMPICGGGEPAKVEGLKDLPIWVFHGGKDQTVPAKRSEEMVDALKAIDAPKVKLTIYPDAGHDSWTETYSNPEAWKWLLQQTKVQTNP